MAALLASCSKEPAEVPEGPASEPLEVNLTSFTYEGLMTELSERTSLDRVVLSDGIVTRTVSLTASDDLDPDQASVLVFNSAGAGFGRPDRHPVLRGYPHELRRTPSGLDRLRRP